jgi:hypothetical protein
MYADENTFEEDSDLVLVETNAVHSDLLTLLLLGGVELQDYSSKIKKRSYSAQPEELGRAKRALDSLNKEAWSHIP